MPDSIQLLNSAAQATQQAFSNIDRSLTRTLEVKQNADAAKVSVMMKGAAFAESQRTNDAQIAGIAARNSIMARRAETEAQLMPLKIANEQLWLQTTADRYKRDIRADGFDATWSIPSLGRNHPQRWTSANAPIKAIEASSFGLNLVTPVDPYRSAERSIKYDALFVGLTFLSLWLFEVLAGVRVHAIQYLLVGGAMMLFYLLELSFAEHLGFGLAYGIASAGVVALIACYAVAILRERRRGGAIGGVVAALCAYLYVLLHNQDHALLVGSVGLFAILEAVMWLTRRVDWYAPASEAD
jgi:hypothetical protein